MKFRGFLTREDIELLEEASKRKLKYPKNPAKKWRCGSCDYTWFYKAVKCPVCASGSTSELPK